MSVALVEPSSMFKNALSNPHKRKREERYVLMAGDVFGETIDPLPVHSTCFYLVSQPEGAVVAVPQ